MSGPITYPDLPGWEFTVDEESPGIYTVTGRDGRGRTVSERGADEPDAVLGRCRSWAAAQDRGASSA